MHRAQGSGSIGSGFRSHEIAVLGVQGSLEQGSRVQGHSYLLCSKRFKGSRVQALGLGSIGRLQRPGVKGPGSSLSGKRARIKGPIA